MTLKTGEREALVAMNPRVFYWSAHHDRSPLLVPARLGLIDPGELRELLIESHRIANA